MALREELEDEDQENERLERRKNEVKEKIEGRTNDILHLKKMNAELQAKVCLTFICVWTVYVGYCVIYIPPAISEAGNFDQTECR